MNLKMVVLVSVAVCICFVWRFRAQTLSRGAIQSLQNAARGRTASPADTINTILTTPTTPTTPTPPNTRTASMCDSSAPLAFEVEYAVVVGSEYPGQKIGARKLCGNCDEEEAARSLEAWGVARLTPPTAADFFQSYLTRPDGSCRFSDGLEVGALHSPAQVGKQCSQGVLYVDQVSSKQLSELYPELRGHGLVNAQLLDDGNTLSKVATNSRGFLVASHVIEHMPRTLAAIETWLRVLRPSGVALLVAPYKCVTFDSNRLITNWNHFLDDYSNSSASPDVLANMWHDHLPEWVLSHLTSRGQNMTGFRAQLEEFSNELRASTFQQRGGMHIHTWSQSSWVSFWRHAQQPGTVGVNFRVLGIGFQGINMYAAIQKL